jgi:hypothetical protein
MTRLRSAIDFSLAVLVAASALYSLPFLVSAAHAGVDPVPAATTSVDAVLAIAQTYGVLWGGVTLAYATVRWLLARNESTHWLAQGRTLATITMLVGTAGSALQAHFAGTPWSGVIATAVLGVVHLADSNVTPAPAPALKTAQAGFARLGMLALLAIAGGLVAGAASCGPKTKAIEHAIWECTAPERAEAVAAITPAVVSVIKAAGSADGSQIDLSTVKSAISKANVLSEAGILLSCATASAIAILEAPAAAAPPAPPGLTARAAPALDIAAVHAAWTAIKRDQLGGADFRVASGAVL